MLKKIVSEVMKQWIIQNNEAKVDEIWGEEKGGSINFYYQPDSTIQSLVLGEHKRLIVVKRTFKMCFYL